MRQLWRSVRAGVWVLTHRRAAEGALAEEMTYFYERAEAEHVRSGLSPDAARRAVRAEFGSPDRAREEVRDFGWERHVVGGVGDLRRAAQRLRAAPSFALVSVLTLALGIGCSTVIFGAVDAVLLRALPYPNAQRLVVLRDYGADGEGIDLTLGTFDELRARSRRFAYLAATDPWRPTLADERAPERLDGARISANYFATLGVRPAAGRDFEPRDDQVGAVRVAIVSSKFARRRFGRGRPVVGGQLSLDDGEYQIIGVLPPAFIDVLSPANDIWAPMQQRSNAPFDSREWGHHYQVLGRLEDGATTDDARRDVASIASTPVAAFARPSWAAMTGGLMVRPLRDAVTQHVGPGLLAIAGAALLLVVIASVNVSSLALARAGKRRGELALRATLGAGQWRLVRQLLVEGLFLSAIGGALGLAVALTLLRVFSAICPAELSRVNAITFDARAFFFSLAATTLAGLGVGILPALGAVRAAQRGEALRTEMSRKDRTSPRMRRALVIAEVACALVLVVSASLLTRSLTHLFAVAPGFDASHLITFQVGGPGATLQSDSGRQHFYRQALEAVRRVPGVARADFTSTLPLKGRGEGYGFQAESLVADRSASGSAIRYTVTPGYFATMGIPVLRGRALQPSDTSGASEAIVVSESFARRIFGNIDPVGQRIRFGPETGSAREWDVIVGVVGDVKQRSLALDGTMAFYVAMDQWGWVDPVQSLVVRTTGSEGALAQRIKSAVWSVDPRRPVQQVATMEDVIAASAAEQRFARMAIGSFALAALVLTAIGMYGVVSESVSERRREIGIRKALGATSRAISVQVVRSGVATAAIGVVVGLGGALVATRMLASLLYGISPVDVGTYAAASIGLGGIVVLASVLPALRAARVDPATPMRSD